MNTHRIDYFSRFKETLTYSDDDLMAEINFQLKKLSTLDPERFKRFSNEIKEQENLLKAKRAIMGVAMIFAGALAIRNDEDFKIFSDKLLLEARDDSELSAYIRGVLLKSEDGAREEVKNQIKPNGKELRKTQIEYDLRLDDFIDRYYKQS